MVDLSTERAARLAERHGARHASATPESIDAAIVATPTSTHLQVAWPLLQRGVYCLVEKPIAGTIEQARALVHPRCAAGHVERFNPALRACGEMAPRRVRALRIAPPTGRSLDVDVILDLMIHDLDLLLAWADAPLEILEANGAPTDGPLDEASAELQSAAGLRATLFSSRIASRRQRTIRCEESGGWTEIDLLAGQVVRDGQPLVLPDRRDALTAQWEDFSLALRAGLPLRGSEGAARAVALAEQIRARIVGEP